MSENYDNYNNRIIETIHHDFYTSYELVKDSINGYYVNLHSKQDKKRVIIAKFGSINNDDNSDFYFASLFWNVIKIKNQEDTK